VVLAEGEGVVAAHAYFVVAHDVDGEIEGFGVVYEGIDPELAYVVAGVFWIVNGAEVGADVEAVLYAAYGEGEAAAAMGEGYTEAWILLEYAAKDHGADGAAGLGGHAYEPGEPVFLHVILAHHLPGVDEDAAAELFGGLPEGREGGIAEVFIVDIRAYLNAGHFELFDAALHFFYGCVYVLHGYGADACETGGVMVYALGNVIIEEAGGFEGMLGLCKIIEEHGDGREDLHADFGHVHFLCANVGIPAVFFYFAEYFVALDHTGAAGLVMLKPDELTITEFLKPVRDVLWHYVGVDVDFQPLSPKGELTI